MICNLPQRLSYLNLLERKDVHLFPLRSTLRSTQNFQLTSLLGSVGLVDPTLGLITFTTFVINVIFHRS